MAYNIGEIIEGKVSGIAKFGVFIDLPDGTRGLVHISEISNNYVKEISDHIKLEEKRKVMILEYDGKKISLSIRKAENKLNKSVKLTSDESSHIQGGIKNKNERFESMMGRFLKDSEKHQQAIARRFDK